jgi:hypothetical protein
MLHLEVGNSFISKLRNSSEDLKLLYHRRENLKSQKLLLCKVCRLGTCCLNPEQPLAKVFTGTGSSVIEEYDNMN